MHAPILIVDDDEAICDLLVTTLALEGLLVRTATDGIAALDEIAKDPPALVLLDLQLPRMNGWDVCWRMRRRGWTAPVVFMTADPYAQGDVVPWGANGYLAKPFDIDQVMKLVERFVDGARRELGTSGTTSVLLPGERAKPATAPRVPDRG